MPDNSDAIRHFLSFLHAKIDGRSERERERQIPTKPHCPKSPQRPPKREKGRLYSERTSIIATLR